MLVRYFDDGVKEATFEADMQDYLHEIRAKYAVLSVKILPVAGWVSDSQNNAIKTNSV